MFIIRKRDGQFYNGIHAASGWGGPVHSVKWSHENCCIFSTYDEALTALHDAQRLFNLTAPATIMRLGVFETDGP